MTEICILFCLLQREMTIYTVRKTIFDLFGAFTKPSHGTIHPALKKLLEDEYVSKRDVLSDGGKKSSYYSITDKGKKLYTELMLGELSNNPTIFLNEICIKYGAISFLSKDNKEQVVKNCERALEIYIAENKRALDNEYQGFNDFQKKAVLYANTRAKALIELLRG